MALSAEAGVVYVYWLSRCNCRQEEGPKSDVASTIIALMLQNQRLRMDIWDHQRRARAFAHGLFSLFKEVILAHMHALQVLQHSNGFIAEGSVCAAVAQLLVQMLTELASTVTSPLQELAT